MQRKEQFMIYINAVNYLKVLKFESSLVIQFDLRNYYLSSSHVYDDHKINRPEVY